MNIKKALSIISGVILLQFGSFAQNLNSEKYQKEINDERANKDNDYKTSEQSPIPNELKAEFKGLNYFDVDPKFRVTASFEKLGDTTSFIMETTKSRYQPEYKPFAHLKFEIDGKTYKLTAFQNVKLAQQEGYENYLFIPFNDLTNGVESYGGGRYIDIQATNKTKIVLDFNKCYNPYCSYNAKYACPIPPDENNLDLMILAGEKTWKKH